MPSFFTKEVETFSRNTFSKFLFFSQPKFRKYLLLSLNLKASSYALKHFAEQPFDFHGSPFKTWRRISSKVWRLSSKVWGLSLKVWEISAKLTLECTKRFYRELIRVKIWVKGTSSKIPWFESSLISSKERGISSKSTLGEIFEKRKFI